MIRLQQIAKNHPLLEADMAVHYSQPKGFVARSICYAIYYNDVYFGTTVGGSATLHLPGRDFFYNYNTPELTNIVNNVFFHIERRSTYPERNFVTKCIAAFRKAIFTDWRYKYGEVVLGFETLIELPRSGECYRRDGWIKTGQTIGYTCKRPAGVGTDGWGGRREWNKVNLRPKLVFMRLP